MFVDNSLKQIQIECLVAFAHSRIIGIAGKGEEGVEVFKNRFVQKDAVNRGKLLSDAIKDLATIDTINEKILKTPNIAIANMYSYHYSKLTSLLDKFIAPNEQFIEGLIGVHLLVLSTKKGYLNYGDNDNLEFFKETIYLYENDNYVGNQEIKETVLNMREISNKIFNDYWKKPSNNKKSKRRAA